MAGLRLKPAFTSLCVYAAVIYTLLGKAKGTSTWQPYHETTKLNSVLHDNGIFPDLSVSASSGPVRSEDGIGALMPWLDKLYMVSYLSFHNAGSRAGFYAIHPNFTKELLVSHNSTYANRLLHRQTNRIIIGAWTVDLQGKIRVFEDLLNVRVGATAEHLEHPDEMVYHLSMDGPLYECSVMTMACKKLFHLPKTLNMPKGEQPHFKAAHTMNGRLVVATNTFFQPDFMGEAEGGRLAEWEGPGHEWKILEKTAFVEITGRRNFGKVIYAVGWDFRSVILKVYCGDEGWRTYRLPKASHAYDQAWQTEWPRIREVETERYLMDAHGMFYELSPLGWAGSTWGVRPISQHLRMVPDFASYRGFLVLAGNQVSSILDNNIVTGQAQSGLWFGKTDDLWSFGKPQGWGAVWRNDTINGHAVSDPYLMTGFDKKILHLILHDKEHKSVKFTLEADITGTAGHRGMEDWVTVESYELSTRPGENYAFNARLLTSFSAHWVRLTATCTNQLMEDPNSCTVTAYFNYT
ncbi:hypothetical protein ElyMa_001970300 [Elysia marginata]|uniref:Uncharacterized protein n=1 Tax=Elysia marginata TaxID=1093978 RepID=A0AAV4EZH1_9GAST|nr:hypothetical protein ElyMa_001970300 [Elysia marginata]